MTTERIDWSTARRASTALDVYLLGRVDFDSAVVLQRKIAADLAERGDRYGALLVCEHPPVVTIGREGSHDDVLVGTHELESLLIDVRRAPRGGRCLLHLPGQLAVYPVLPVKRLEIGLAQYRRLLEDAMIETCHRLRIASERRDDEPGVWCRLGRLAYVGAAVRNGISCHGAFLNVSPDLNLMRTIQSCRPGERITSMSAQRERPISMHAVRSNLIDSLAARLGYDTHHLYTSHPLLRRTKKTVYDYA